MLAMGHLTSEKLRFARYRSPGPDPRVLKFLALCYPMGPIFSKPILGKTAVGINLIFLQVIDLMDMYTGKLQ
jgi:hypothetical protein